MGGDDRREPHFFLVHLYSAAGRFSMTVRYEREHLWEGAVLDRALDPNWDGPTATVRRVVRRGSLASDGEAEAVLQRELPPPSF